MSSNLEKIQKMMNEKNSDLTISDTKDENTDSKDKSIQMSIGELYTYNEELILKLENGVIKIIELQPEGKTRMDASSFIRGHEITKIEKIT